jgi:hypothetical protein
MKKKLIPILLVSLYSLLLWDCKKTFTPQLKQSDLNVLVVEGYIDGADTVFFKLSRSRKIYPGDSATSKNELNAHVTVEDDHNNSYPLIESGNGSYKSSGILNLNSAFQYRLHIITSDGKEYASDFVPYKICPPIDSVSWELKDGGVQIYANAHDGNNNTRYYRWNYIETWQFHAWYYSILKYDMPTNTVVNRTELVYTCWRSNNSSSILIGSSARLANDVISKAPLVYVTNHDPKMDILYSILVKQLPLDLKGYNYLSAMKNNTESTGSISDAQPSQVSGNIHNVNDASEQVIGYVGAGNHLEKRIFIDYSSLPAGWVVFNPCSPTETITFGHEIDFYKKNLEAVDYAYDASGNNIIGYSASTKSCVDCTLFGTNVKPTFWP